MRLVYVGPDPAIVGVVPLPEGWPAFDHEETDQARASEKVASGSYVPAEPFEATEPVDPDQTATPPQGPVTPASRTSRRPAQAEE